MANVNETPKTDDRRGNTVTLASDDTLAAVSQMLIEQNAESYGELAK